ISRPRCVSIPAVREASTWLGSAWLISSIIGSRMRWRHYGSPLRRFPRSHPHIGRWPPATRIWVGSMKRDRSSSGWHHSRLWSCPPAQTVRPPGAPGALPAGPAPGGRGGHMRKTRRLAAILAADVAGYSRLMGADEEGTHERLKAHLQGLVEPKIVEHRGGIV